MWMLTFPLSVTVTIENMVIKTGFTSCWKEKSDKENLASSSFLPICEKTHTVKSQTDDMHSTKKTIVLNLLATFYQPTLIALSQHIHTYL